MSDTQKFYSKSLHEPFSTLGNLADGCIAATGYEAFRILFNDVMYWINKADSDSNYRWSNEAISTEFNLLSSTDKPWYAFSYLKFSKKYWQTSDQPFKKSNYENHTLLGQAMDWPIHKSLWGEMHLRIRGNNSDNKTGTFFALDTLKKFLTILCNDLLEYQDQKRKRLTIKTLINGMEPYSIEAQFIDSDIHGKRLWILIVLWNKDEPVKAYIMKVTTNSQSTDTSERWDLIKNITQATPGKHTSVNNKHKSYTIAKLLQGTCIKIGSSIVIALFANRTKDTITRREWPVIFQNQKTNVNLKNLAKEIKALEEYDLNNRLSDDNDELATPLLKGFA